METTVHERRIAAMSLSDPRCYQIAVLASLVLFGVFVLHFGVTALQFAAIVSTALATQYAGTRLRSLPAFDPLSAVITSLSLTLLLRTDLVAISTLAAVLAIGSKFLVRINGKHIFNPANFGIVAMIMLSDRAWISTGQWGSATIGAFALACLGFLVLTRARRAETTLAFLAGFAALVFGRALWLGDPLAIPLHQLQNGTLLIFAFFMISDPKTTPNSKTGRIGYGLLVAAVSFVIQFVFFEPGAPVLALIACSPVVPLIDLLSRGEIYSWAAPARRIVARPAARPVRMS